MPSNGTNLLRAKPNRAEKKEHTLLPLFRAEHRKEERSPGELKALKALITTALGGDRLPGSRDWCFCSEVGSGGVGWGRKDRKHRIFFFKKSSDD